MKKPSIFTIGHSTWQIDEFIGLLQTFDVKEVVDVRTIPKSCYDPQFHENELRLSLRQAHIHYKHLKKLGGLRHAMKNSINLGWRNASFGGYADYMTTVKFTEGLDVLN